MRPIRSFGGVAALILLGAVLVLFSPGGARAGIATTAHDLSGVAGYGTNQICIFCHTPHNSYSPQLVPLWNHTTTGATFTPYSSSTLNASTGQPGGVSKACLSCHDGVTNVDAYQGHTGTTPMGGTAALGADLSNDHPVSITYDNALFLADGGLNDPATLTGVKLYSEKVECGSCHNVHDNSNSPFLRLSNAQSVLCLKCHNK